MKYTKYIYEIYKNENSRIKVTYSTQPDFTLTPFSKLDEQTRNELNEQTKTTQLQKMLSNILENYSNVTSLDLSGNEIEDFGVCQLRKILEKNKDTLTSVNLKDNKLSAKGIEELSEMLKGFPNLTKLDISDNQIHLPCLEQLFLTPYLKELNAGLITYNGAEEGGADAVGKALRENTSLTYLNLGNNKIGDKWVKVISEALKENQTLTYLNLGGNNIGNEGAGYIAEILKLNSGLTDLQLYVNKIGDEGITTIAEALTTNSTLKGLNVGTNKITDLEAKEILKTLRTNSTLKELELGDNKITNSCLGDMAKELIDNSTLVYLGLQGNEVSPNKVKKIDSILKHNLEHNYDNLNPDIPPVGLDSDNSSIDA